MRSVALPALLCLLLLAFGDGRELRKSNEGTDAFNHTLAMYLAEYASAVYMTDLSALSTWTCSRCNGLIEGFEIQELIVDIQNCLQAFVGVDHNLNSVIVAIRGTQENSIQNWIQDLLWKQLDLKLVDIPGAMVHSGFFSAYNNTKLHSAITGAVHGARKLYGKIDVLVTGHSMGGAIASFCALDLAINHGVGNVKLMTFGQPRVGNAAFASYFAKHVPAIRITNQNDIVPHLPPYFYFFSSRTYHHFPREVWLHRDEDGNIVEKICDDSGEDSSCCRSIWIPSASDHFAYYGIAMEADDWSTCRIIMDSRDRRPPIDAVMSRPSSSQVAKER